MYAKPYLRRKVDDNGGQSSLPPYTRNELSRKNVKNEYSELTEFSRTERTANRKRSNLRVDSHVRKLEEELAKPTDAGAVRPRKKNKSLAS